MADAPSRAVSGGGVAVPLSPTNVALGPSQPNRAAGITTGGGADWFGPGNPLMPVAPTEVAGRMFDVRPAVNLVQRKRKYEPLGPDQLRALARGWSVLAAIIEARKDQMCSLTWDVGAKDGSKLKGDQVGRAKKIEEFFRRPQKDLLDQQTWLRKLLDDIFILDAPTLFPRMTRGGSLYELVVMDGGTINPVLDDWGRVPDPPRPAWQQILHGLAAVDYVDDRWPEDKSPTRLIYRPRNPRPDKMFGFSPVEQIVMIVNIAIRREAWQLKFFTEGTVPDALLGTPADWTPDQVRAFQEWWDSVQLSASGGRRGVRFVQGEVAKSYVVTKDTPLFGEADEWLTRVACYVFQVSPQGFVKMMNRATGETQKEIAEEQGMRPLMTWIKSLLDDIIARYFDSPDLGCVWDVAKEIDPQALSTMVTNEAKAGIRAIDEAREAIGLDPLGGDFAKPMAFTAMNGYEPIDANDQIERTKQLVAGGAMKDPQAPPPPSPFQHPGAPGAPPGGPPKPGGDSGGSSSAAGSGGGGAPRGNADKAEPRGALAKANAKAMTVDRKVGRDAIDKVAAAAKDAFKQTADVVAGEIQARLRHHKIAKVGGDEPEEEAIALTDAEIRRLVDSLDLTSLAGMLDATDGALFDMAIDSASKALAMVGVAADDELVNRVNAAAVAFARDRAAELVGKRWTSEGKLIDNPNPVFAITESTRNDLRATIAKGLEDNIGTPAIADSIRSTYAFSDQRADLVARTEVSRANEQGKLVGWRAAESTGLTIQKSWLTSGDDDVCEEICQPNEDDGPIGLDEDFGSGDDAPPGHPNCECVLVAEVVDDDAGEDEGGD